MKEKNFLALNFFHLQVNLIVIFVIFISVRLFFDTCVGRRGRAAHCVLSVLVGLVDLSVLRVATRLADVLLTLLNLGNSHANHMKPAVAVAITLNPFYIVTFN